MITLSSIVVQGPAAHLLELGGTCVCLFSALDHTRRSRRRKRLFNVGGFVVEATPLPHAFALEQLFAFDCPTLPLTRYSPGGLLPLPLHQTCRAAPNVFALVTKSDVIIFVLFLFFVLCATLPTTPM